MILFNTKQAATIAVNKDVAFLEGGIHENVILKDILIDKTATQSWFIRFTYQSESGKTMQHTEFEPNRMPTQNDAEFQNSVFNQINRIVNNQIRPYFGYENGERSTDDSNIPQFEGESFRQFIDWVKETIQEKAQVTPVRIKVIYGRKGYTALPNYSKYTSVEPMDVTNSAIIKLSIDNFEPVKVDDETKQSNVKVDPLLSQKPLTENASGLPF